jgi:hypothetical protein
MFPDENNIISTSYQRAIIYTVIFMAPKTHASSEK